MDTGGISQSDSETFRPILKGKEKKKKKKLRTLCATILSRLPILFLETARSLSKQENHRQPSPPNDPSSTLNQLPSYSSKFRPGPNLDESRLCQPQNLAPRANSRAESFPKIQTISDSPFQQQNLACSAWHTIYHPARIAIETVRNASAGQNKSLRK